MKRLILFTFIVLSALTVYGQKKSKPEPLIIKGQLTNYPEKKLRVGFDNGNGVYICDTTTVDNDGKFYLKTFKIKNPQLVNMGYYKTLISDIAVAPGYNLTITADCKDFNAILKTIKIQGIGAETNAYAISSLKTEVAENKPTAWYELNDNDFLAYIKRDLRLKDSLVRLYFGKKPASDKCFNYFKQMAQLDNMFRNIYHIIAHADENIFLKKFDYQQATAFVNSHADKHLLDNIDKEEYMISRDYKTVLGTYLRYLTSLDYLKDSTLRNRKYYVLEKAGKLYSGTAREYVFYNLITSSSAVPAIIHASSFTDLNKRIEQLKPYIATLSTPLKRAIDRKVAERNAELARTAIGRPAPPFTLPSNQGKTYSLAEFKGKVVFLDMWASWCHPCREETPHLKTLYNKYKKDDRIAFISIAINDTPKDWQKAIQDDKPDWLQLTDKNQLVANAYAAHFIPKFILIDKQGNIAMLDTPLPSTGKKLEDVLLKEMTK